MLRRLAILSTIILPLAGPAAAEGSGTFTLEEVLSAPYPTQLATASGADRVAWVLDERGARNVWFAADGSGPRRLTSFEADDGQVIGGLRLTPSGDVVVFVRGGGPNRAGERPNPTSDPDGVEQVVWAMSTDGGEAWRLGEGASPVLSPGGDEVVFGRDGALYRVALGGSAPAGKVEAELLFEARGRSRGPVYSPDGDRLAFVSDRGDHSFIGVYDLAERRISWVAPSVDRDDFPVFSPDGRRLAFLRRDGALKDEVFNFLISWPFRLMVADLASGEATERWRSPDTGGGFAQIYPSHPLRWADRHLVFFSEHEGWMHLYAIPADGGEVIDLTPGTCEAEHSDLSPDGAWLVVSHNCADIDRRQVARLAVAGGERDDLAGATGIHTWPAFADDGEVVYLRSSDARRPVGIARVASGGGELVRLQTEGWAEGFDPADLVEPRPVVIESLDELEVHAQLFEPAGGAPPGGRPALVFMHGGPMRQMLLGWHYIGYYSRCYAFNQYMASRGWTVLSVNFRSGIGYGQDFRLAPAQGPYGASEYQDIVAAGRWLAALESVDADRIALWGGSYGGYLTALGLARDSDLFAAGVDLHGVHDWSFRATDFTEGGGWGLVGDEALDLALESSPAVDVSAWTSPVLLVHGDDDRNVLFQQTTDLVVRLRRAGLEPEIMVLPDEVHGFLRHESWRLVFERAAEFLERHLGVD